MPVASDWCFITLPRSERLCFRRRYQSRRFSLREFRQLSGSFDFDRRWLGHSFGDWLVAHEFC